MKSTSMFAMPLFETMNRCSGRLQEASIIASQV